MGAGLAGTLAAMSFRAELLGTVPLAILSDARSLATPLLRRLAPIWLCMNAILGLWLGPTLYFLLTNRR